MAWTGSPMGLDYMVIDIAILPHRPPVIIIAKSAPALGQQLLRPYTLSIINDSRLLWMKSRANCALFFLAWFCYTCTTPYDEIARKKLTMTGGEHLILHLSVNKAVDLFLSRTTRSSLPGELGRTFRSFFDTLCLRRIFKKNQMSKTVFHFCWF